MKKCNKCNTVKDFSDFRKNKCSKDGYYLICKDCKKVLDKIYRDKESSKKIKQKWLEDNKERTKESNKKYYYENINDIKEYSKNYYSKKSDKIKERVKVYRSANKDKRSLYDKKRRTNDPIYYIIEKIRGSINKSFYRNGFKKISNTRDILGCEFDEFKLYLESKFEDWMTWENKGLYNGDFNYGWDIDHIIPISYAETEDDVIKLNHYTNLQPLCSKINREIKRDL